MATQRPAGLVPVGCVVAYLKSLTNCPALPDEFVECNGQALSGGSADPQSVFNGGTIPNLNGASTGTKRFLRGSATSGTVATNEAHIHTQLSLCGSVNCGMGCGVYSGYTNTASSLPSYYEVVWVMRIK